MRPQASEIEVTPSGSTRGNTKLWASCAGAGRGAVTPGAGAGRAERPRPRAGLALRPVHLGPASAR